MTGAFAYLIVTAARNQVRRRVARLRNPRYALALVVGVTYLWFVYLRPSHDRPQAEDILGPSAIALLPLALLAFVAWTWLSGSEQGALAFSPAEVSLLFPAPVTRRTLVLYRIARTQVRILVTSVVWTLVFRQAASVADALAHIVAYWVVLSALNLNRLGVALVHAGGGRHGLRGARRNWLAIAVFVTIALMVLVPLARAWPSLRVATTPSAIVAAVIAALGSRSATVALTPFRLLLAPLALPPGVEWLAALAPALALCLGLAAWVLSADAAFEEAAVEASARQAQRFEARRARRTATVTPGRRANRTLPLSPTGAPAIALLWKNGLWLLRSGTLRGLVVPPAIALASVIVIAPRSPGAGFVIAVVCGVFAAVMLFLGPLSMRNDLRGELLHVSLLRTFPLRGRDVIMAEVASSALPMALMQYLLGLVALLALSIADVGLLAPAMRVALAVAGLPVLLGVNAAVFMIHNAIALFFPGWVRLGASDGGGVETLGLGMINMALALFMLAALLIVPAIVAGAAWLALRATPSAAVAAGGVAGALALLGEWVACAWLLGGTLERVEPMHVEA